MAYEERYRPSENVHNIIMEGRRKISLSGAEDVESFDEEAIIINTAKGTLVIRGQEMHIEKLSLDSGEVIIEGTIDALEYEDDARAPEGGFFSRLFR